MELLIGIIVIVLVIAIPRISVNSKLDNYDMSKVSSARMAQDAGKSKYEIRKNLVNGKYDKRPGDRF